MLQYQHIKVYNKYYYIYHIYLFQPHLYRGNASSIRISMQFFILTLNANLDKRG